MPDRTAAKSLHHDADTKHRLVRGQILHFLADPGREEASDVWRYFADGALWIEDGRIAAAGNYEEVVADLPPERLAQAAHDDYRGHLILPGFVDCHCHYAQIGAMAAGGRLLDWLKHHIFPAEAAFADPAIAEAEACHFVARLLAHGTTTASVFATVHSHSVDALMSAAAAQRLRLLAGKVMMDRHAPPELCDDVASGERDCLALIERWHGHDRLRYTLTPRFAPTSSPEQLALVGALFHARPDLHMQSHLAETPEEVAWVRRLFPHYRDYFDLYLHYGLSGPRAIHGHGIHLSPAEIDDLAASGTAIAHCPTSNLFLGSGFFRHAQLADAGVCIGLATDVGGGTSLSLIRTLSAAYQVAQAVRAPLPTMRGWYLATLGGARALCLDQFIGNFQPGKEADFVVLDSEATPDLAWRQRHTTTLEERLFALMILGDERCVVATHVLGEPTYLRT
jgi:guanine deaminase